MSFVLPRQCLLVSLILLVSNVGAPTCSETAAASASKIEVWDIKQQTDQLGPVELFVSPSAIKFVTEKGGFTIFSKAPTWKIVGYNKTENTGFTISIQEWPKNGLKMFKGSGNYENVKPTTFFDPILKLDLLQRQVAVIERYYGDEDPTIFRSAKKRMLTGMRIRVAPQIKLDEFQKKVVQGIYTVPFLGGFPIELSNITKDGDSGNVYNTLSIKKANVDPAIFDYPKNYKVVKEKLDVYVTHKQRKTFEEFLDVFTDDPGLRKNSIKSNSK